MKRLIFLIALLISFFQINGISVFAESANLTVLIDDMESYSSEDVSNPPWDTWIDGWEIPTNGSLAGYIPPPCMEHTIIHSGDQSLPVQYNNTGTALCSEVKRTFDVAQDWTASGADILRLYVAGFQDNDTSTLYIGLDDTTQRTAFVNTNINSLVWTNSSTWYILNIPLSEFADAGIDLTDVNAMYIRIGTSGNLGDGVSGVLFFDDIGLIQTVDDPYPWQENGMYIEDFEDETGPEWSSSIVDVTPVGQRQFLGQFGNDTVNLTLNNIPAHNYITISFDLFVIRTWDGGSFPDNNDNIWGPDIWSMSCNGQEIITTSFDWGDASWGDRQYFPGNFEEEFHPSGTGAAEHNTLGFLFEGETADYVYHLSFSLPNNSSTLIVDFTGFGLQEISDESWGLDNVIVEVSEENPVPFTAYNPWPSNGAENISPSVLWWKSGQTAAYHDIYLGLNPDLDLNDFVARQSETILDIPYELIPGATYYWRVDEVEENRETIYSGEVWSFVAFEPVWKTLTISSTEGGTVTDPGVGVYTYGEGTTVPVVAAAEANYHFVNWTGTAVTSGKVASQWSASTTVIMDANYTLAANFDFGIEEPVYFADPNLKKAVETTLGINNPTKSNMLDLTSLTVWSREITNITGLEYAENMQVLYLIVNQIIDISPLAKLTNLTTLYLGINQISDISPLVGLTNLQRLGLRDNQVSDISALSEMTYLTFLDLRGNPLNYDAYYVYIPQIFANNPGIELYNDAEPVWKTLSISSTEGGAVTIPGEGQFRIGEGREIAIEAMPEGGNEFAFWSGTAVDAGKVEDPNAALTTVVVDGNYTLVGNFLEEPVYFADPNLKAAVEAELGISNPTATDMLGLTELTIDNLGITDLTGLEYAANMETFFSEDNPISSIKPLAGLTNLKTIIIWGSQISDISPLAGLTNLNIISLPQNRISDISALIKLTNLTFLELLYNPLNIQAYNIHLPQIIQNNPSLIRGDNLFYDDLVVQILTINSDGNGSVIMPGEGQFEVSQGTVMTIEAVPADSSTEFAGWTGTAVDNGKVEDPNSAKTTVLVDSDYTLSAVFTDWQSGTIPSFLLSEIDADDPMDMYYRITSNNTEEITFVERVTGIDPDPDGMIRMQVNDDESARMKSYFGKTDMQTVFLRFRYLFENPEALDIIIYLSNVPELMDHDDAGRSEHYIEVGRVPAPPQGSPGAFGSGQFGTFAEWVSTGSLNFSDGLWVELELAASQFQVYSEFVLSNTFGLFSSATSSSSTVIDDLSLGHCSSGGICMDITGDDQPDEEDFIKVITLCGNSTGLLEGSYNQMCLDTIFDPDGYVDSYDIVAWDWMLNDIEHSSRLNLCGVPVVPMTSDTCSCSLTYSLLAGTSEPVSPVDLTNNISDLLIVGKRNTSEYPYLFELKDRLYLFDSNKQYVGWSESISERCNVRLVKDSEDTLFQVNSDSGIVRLDGSGEVIVPPGQTAVASEPRYSTHAEIYIGVQNDAFGRPVLDAAFDMEDANYVYVVPVVVNPDGEEAYLAAAKLQLFDTGEPPYQVVQLYDDSPAANDNRYRGNLREIEIDDEGNIYVINAHSVNESDILWKYSSDGTLLNRLELGKSDSNNVPDPMAMYVSNVNDMVYIASGQDCNDINSTKIYGFSIENLTLQRTVTINNMQHVTGITGDSSTGKLWIAGFNMLYDLPDSPCLASIPLDSENTEDALPLGDCDLVLPMSIIWTGEIN